jgi:hypothetical protein
VRKHAVAVARDRRRDDYRMTVDQKREVADPTCVQETVEL